MKRALLPLALALLLPACADTPTDPSVTGPIQVSVVAAETGFAVCGAEIPVTATVTDARGKGVPNFHLNFNVLSGGGVVYGGSALTNGKGIAKDIWTVGNIANLSNTLAVRTVDPVTGSGTQHFTQTVITLSKIAFTRQGSIYVMNADGTAPSLLVEGGDPAWSPDGSKIAFANNGIYVINAGGLGGATPLTTAQLDYEPAWSPDGKKIAFTRQGSSSIYPEIYVMNADGTGQTMLTDANSASDFEPAWSPDGSKIAFTSDRDGGQDVYVMHADGTRPVRLTTSGGKYPAWSPDGRKIAFVGDGIYVMNADGSGVKVIFSDQRSSYYYHHPTWSPDGSKIAFEFYPAVSGPNHEIVVVNADGSDQTAPPTEPAHNDMTPAWSGCTAL